MTQSMQTTGRRWRIKVTPLRILILLGLILAIILSGGTWFRRNWTPDHKRYPLQGVTVSAANGEIIWPTAKAAGVDFAYLHASAGATQRDARFADNLNAVREAGVRHGAVHRYSLCAGATAQATNFIATVPRDETDMLPPVVLLDLANDCAKRPNRDQLLAELNIFLNQIEMHSGKAAILRVTQAFEEAYEISAGIDRTLWLDGDFFAPDYATRGWVMWTASTSRHVPGIEGAVDWDVVRP